MKTKEFVKKITRTLIGAFAIGILTLPLLAEPDYGDHSSSTLTTKAWNAMAQQQYDDALAYIAKCEELYGAEAKKMQASLTNYAPNDPKEETTKLWALNDVGTCMFIKGEVLLKKGDKKGALEAFNKLVKEYKYAQCWDPKGWFWKPAEAAKQKIVELQFENE
ncbi:MAG TPA: hypothetical protein P5270_02180 [Victivallales bacterium]|nr:hypothetical protein [Victivallales bacterium]HRR28146.1 hypothetical protein [Victivallales bacterium]